MGFEAVAIDAIAEQAGVSKMTIYSHFGDKDTLFENFVKSISDEVNSALTSPAVHNGGLREQLVATGRAFLTTILGPTAPGLFLSISALHDNLPLAKRFYKAGPGRTRAALVAIINDNVKRGELSVDRAEWAADDLIGLWDGGISAKIIFGVGGSIGKAEIERRANRAVDVFLQAYAPPVHNARFTRTGPS
jgi:TetR/AcrR family transcriptional repressor of mexJK operon